MKLVCPTCDLTKSRAFVSARLETCPRCATKGRQSYLIPADELPKPPAARRPERSQDRES
jgi:Zn-finger nucleic acid-binding protein